MATKLSVGLSQKVGQPDYGSLGASCQVEFEIDRSTFEHNSGQFQQQVRQAFEACRQAVQEQLQREQHPHHSSGQANGNGHANGNGYQRNGTHQPRPATASQARAIRAIANRRKVDLQSLLAGRFSVQQPEDLSIGDASSLIDELKQPGEQNGGGQ